MPRIQAVDPAQAQGKAGDLLETVKQALGMVPNLLRTLAHAPAALEFYLASSKALSGGRLSAKLREQLAVAIAGENTCDYCASAHTALGRAAGVPNDELVRNLTGASANPQIEAALTFARAVVAKRGLVSDAEFQKVRDAGYDDGEITEIVAHVAHNTFTNYYNHVAATEIDFPVVRTRKKAAA